jgi:hypothetical protein
MLLKISSLCTAHKFSVSTCFSEQIMPILLILCYNGRLVTWTVVSLTTAVFKPLTFSVSGCTILLYNRIYMEKILRSQIYVTTNGQSVSLSWRQAPIWDLRPIFFFCLTVAGLLMWGVLSGERTGLFFTLYKVPYIYILHVWLYIHSIYKASISPGSVQQHLPHRKHIFHYCVFSRCRKNNVFTELFPSNGCCTVECLQLLLGKVSTCHNTKAWTN